MPSLAVPGRGRYNSGPRGSQQLRTKQESAMGEPSPGAPSERPPEDRLDSWKEIAAYLNRDVTTVQRWEKREGMPVHRHLHDRSGSVYAYGPELDAWLNTRKMRLEDEEKEQAAEEPEDERGIENVGWTHGTLRWLVLAGVAGLVLLALTYSLIPRHTRSATQSKITSHAVLPLR